MPDHTLIAEGSAAHTDARGPLVSIVLPAFNADRFLWRTVQSVLAQTYASWELLIVDDGSDDETANIAMEHVAADGRIRLLTQENQGVAVARNHGLKVASGEFVATLDADDLWHPTKLEKQVAALRDASEHVGVSYAWSARIDDSDAIIEYAPEIHADGPVFGPMLYRNFIGNGSTPLIRRACFDAVGDFSNHRQSVDGQGCEDWDMYLRISECYEFCVVPEYLVGYRHVPQSMSSDHSGMCRSYDKMIADLRRRRGNVPEHLLHWSRSNFYLFLTGQSYQCEDYPTALSFAWRAVRLDREAMMSPRMLLVVAKCLTRSVLAPILTRGPRRPEGDATEQQWPETRPNAPDLSLLQALSPYGRLRRHRWQRLLLQPIPCHTPTPTQTVGASAR